MTPNAFEQTKNALLELGGQRVWSLMVTLFGDLAQSEGSYIDGPVLSAIMSKMDVQPAALRVALHRLRNDGWIASEKQGRTGRHMLTPSSRIETQRASTRIYASPNTQSNDWQLVLLEDIANATKDEMLALGFVPVMPRVYLGGENAVPPSGVLAMNGQQIPDWLRTQIAPQMLEDEYEALLPVLQTAYETLPSDGLDPLHIAVIRCLIVHNWRRIALRHPALPTRLLPANCAGQRCHVLVDALLTRFPRPKLVDIPPR